MGIEDKRGTENIAWRLAQVEAMLNRPPMRELVANLLQAEPGASSLEFSQAQMRAEIFLDTGEGVVGAREFFERLLGEGLLDERASKLLKGLYLLYVEDRNGNGNVEVGRDIGPARISGIVVPSREYSEEGYRGGLRGVLKKARKDLRVKARRVGWNPDNYRVALVSLERTENKWDIDLWHATFTATFMVLSRKPEVIGKDSLVWLHNTLADLE